MIRYIDVRLSFSRKHANSRGQGEVPAMPAYHDLGGRSAGPIDRTERTLEPWEKRIDAMVQLLSARERRLISVDELRRAIEGLGTAEYDRLSYYERWLAGVTNLLLEKGVLTAEEIGRKLDEVRQREGATP